MQNSVAICWLLQFLLHSVVANILSVPGQDAKLSHHSRPPRQYPQDRYLSSNKDHLKSILESSPNDRYGQAEQYSSSKILASVSLTNGVVVTPREGTQDVKVSTSKGTEIETFPSYFKVSAQSQYQSGRTIFISLQGAIRVEEASSDVITMNTRGAVNLYRTDGSYVNVDVEREIVNANGIIVTPKIKNQVRVETPDYFAIETYTSGLAAFIPGTEIHSVVAGKNGSVYVKRVDDLEVNVTADGIIRMDNNYGRQVSIFPSGQVLQCWTWKC